MNIDKDKDQKLLKARDKVQKIKMFYLHLMLYIIVVILLVYNLYIVQGPFANNITALNVSILVLWTLFIIVHALSVFRGSVLFNKKWEEKKTEAILKEKENEKEEAKLWE